MGGFEYNIVDTPEKIQKVVDALEQWRRYLKLTEPALLELGLLRYSVFKDGNDVMWKVVNTKTDKLERFERVKDIFGDKLENGKWMIYWFEIEWLNKLLPTLMRLKQACKESGCLDFWNELVSASERLSARVIGMLSSTLKDVIIEENREW